MGLIYVEVEGQRAGQPGCEQSDEEGLFRQEAGPLSSKGGKQQSRWYRAVVTGCFHVL